MARRGSPPRRVENKKKRTARRDLLLTVLKTKVPDGKEEFSSSPCRKPKSQMARRNSPPRRAEYQKTSRRGGILLLAVLKTKEPPDGEEGSPPRRVKNKRTRRRGGTSSSPC